MKKIGLFTSGGDSPGMNACIRSVVRTALHYDLEVMGIRRGYKGMIDGDIIPMDALSVSNIIQRGGTILFSSRSERFRKKEGRKKAFENLQEQGIDGLVAIGGNGTFTGAKVFAEEFNIPIIGVPGTIDNDLYGTDFTLGYDTAINTVIQAIDRIRDTANSHNRIFFVEVMGRDSGFIALHTGLAGGAESILIPEMQTDILNLIKLLNKGWKRKKSSLIVLVAEGDEAGGALKVAEIVKKDFPEFECRVSILGHMQRGGSPSCNDRLLGTVLGVAAVEALLAGKRNVMAGKSHNEVVFVNFEECISNKQKIDNNLFRIIDILSQ